MIYFPHKIKDRKFNKSVTKYENLIIHLLIKTKTAALMNKTAVLIGAGKGTRTLDPRHGKAML